MSGNSQDPYLARGGQLLCRRLLSMNASADPYIFYNPHLLNLLSAVIPSRVSQPPASFLQSSVHLGKLDKVPVWISGT